MKASRPWSVKTTPSACCSAPLVRGRKGHYRELFETIQSRATCTGSMVKWWSRKGLPDRYKVHDIEVVVDDHRLLALDDDGNPPTKTPNWRGAQKKMRFRLAGKKKREGFRPTMPCPGTFPAPSCARTGISYAEPEPNLFSFNSPYGAQHLQRPGTGGGSLPGVIIPMGRRTRAKAVWRHWGPENRMDETVVEAMPAAEDIRPEPI